jgi:hypothetical protein
MPEQLVPASQLAVGDRMWMGGRQLWATVTAITDDPQGVTVSVFYPDGGHATFTRSPDFRIRVDRATASGTSRGRG